LQSEISCKAKFRLWFYEGTYIGPAQNYGVGHCDSIFYFEKVNDVPYDFQIGNLRRQEATVTKSRLKSSLQIALMHSMKFSILEQKT